MKQTHPYDWVNLDQPLFTVTIIRRAQISKKDLTIAYPKLTNQFYARSMADALKVISGEIYTCNVYDQIKSATIKDGNGKVILKMKINQLQFMID